MLDFVQPGLASVIWCINGKEMQSVAQLLLLKCGLGPKSCGFPRKCAQLATFSLFGSLLQPVVSNKAANKTQDLLPSSTPWLFPGPGISGASLACPVKKPSSSIPGDLTYLF